MIKNWRHFTVHSKKCYQTFARRSLRNIITRASEKLFSTLFLRGIKQHFAYRIRFMVGEFSYSSSYEISPCLSDRSTLLHISSFHWLSRVRKFGNAWNNRNVRKLVRKRWSKIAERVSLEGWAEIHLFQQHEAYVADDKLHHRTLHQNDFIINGAFYFICQVVMMIFIKSWKYFGILIILLLPQHFLKIWRHTETSTMCTHT